MATTTLRQRNGAAQAAAGSNGSTVSEKDKSTFSPPEFTIKELLDCIPRHCFERSAIKSTAYLLRDFFYIACLATFAYNISTYVGKDGSLLNGNAGIAASWACWLTYWWFQGLVMTGVWVIAHECGHQAYSTSKTINNAVGLVLHSALLVPYHSWRISHAKHHAATGHMTRDQVFVPKTASQLGIQKPEGGWEAFAAKADDILEDSPIYIFLCVLAQQLFGWPMYLIRNASGQKTYPKMTNHFNPDSVIFEPRHYGQIILSDIGLAVVIAALVYWGKQTSLSTVLSFYGLPYLVVNHMLVCITFLQHTDPELPHYREGEFNFQRGALCTKDRNIWNTTLHGISNTHVLHHLKSSIPHYHADEATAALKEKLGDYYTFTDEHWLVALQELQAVPIRR